MNVSLLQALALFRVPLKHSTKPAAGGIRGRSAHPRRRNGSNRFEQLEARLALAVTVTNTNDAGAGSLREAITTVNAAAIANTITFQDLAIGTITPLTALPPLTNPAGTIFSFGGSTTAITLDGASIPNADGLTIGAGVNSLVISGLNLTLSNFDSGLKFLGGSTGSTVNGLTLKNNTNGIELVGGALTGTTIAGNTISLNSQNGVLATGGVTGLTLGGSGAGNTVQYNQTGFFFQQGSFASTVVQANAISANYGDGILLGSGGGVVTGLTIGGTASGAANTISFNQDNGVEVRPGTFTNTVVSGNTIASNGGYGISLFPSGQTLQGLTVGGTTAGAGNTIESNEADGVGIFGGTYTGTAVQGNTIRYNQNGVSLNVRAGGDAFSGLLLGGDNAGSNTAVNTITQNSLDGVLVNAGVYSSTFIRGNTISSNGRNGVNFLATFGEKITGLQLGGSTSTLANTITGNAASGLAASKGDYSETVVLGNTLRANRIGISLAGAQNLNIGGVATAFRNTIDGNAETGLFATGDLTGTMFQGNSLTGNPVGVSLIDALGVSIGSAAAGGGNTIAGGSTGVRAVGNVTGTTIAGNAITGQTTGIQLINASASSAALPFFVGGAASKVGNGAGNYVASTVHGIYAAGPLTNATIAGNIFSASAFGGNAMVLENATGLTVGGSTAGFGNTLTAARGNGLWAAGILTGSGFYKNTLTASQNGALLINARNFLFGVANNAALGNTVQYNQVGVRALGNCAGSGVCFTTWTGNVRKILNTATGLLVTPKP
jgi:hypothetical protein